MVSKFLERCEQAEFHCGGNRKFRITLHCPGMFVTWLCIDEGGWEVITNGEEGTIFYETFAAALEAVIEHNHQM